MFVKRILILAVVKKKTEAYKSWCLCREIKTSWQHSEECMCCLRNIAMLDYQESVTTGQTDTQTDGRTDRRRTKWSLCASMLRRRHKNDITSFATWHIIYLPQLSWYFTLVKIPLSNFRESCWKGHQLDWKNVICIKHEYNLRIIINAVQWAEHKTLIRSLAYERNYLCTIIMTLTHNLMALLQFSC